MIHKLSLKGFKGFRNFSAVFRSSAVMVGPNNAGKSTLVSALRTSGLMLEYAARHRAQASRQHNGNPVMVHYFSREQFGLDDENIRFDLLDAEASFVLMLDGQARLTAVWPADSEDDPFFYLQSSGGVIHETPASVRTRFRSIGVVPSVVPLEPRERILSPEYIRKNLGGRLSSRHFRNQLLLMMDADADELQGFLDLVAEWLPEIELEMPQAQRNLDESSIDLYYTEDRRPREIAWAGDGLQVFLQLLWHIHRLRKASTLILDEPEVYLHPDLQRRLVQVLVASGQQYLLATHSPEIVAEAPQQDLLWVDRKRRSARRVDDEGILADLSASIGSPFNLGLARVLRTKVAVFVEGHDMTVLRRLASVADLDALSREQGVAFVPLGGVAKHTALEGFSWLANEFLGSAVRGYVVLDRDYKTDDECHALRDRIRSWALGCHIWRRHELENYLLAPALIGRLTELSVDEAKAVLEQALELVKEEVFAGVFGSRSRPLREQGKSDKTVAQLCRAELNERWVDYDARLALCPGKETLSALNGLLQERGKKALTTRQLCAGMLADEIPEEMRAVLEDLQALVVGPS
jgi:predicted ATPase